MIKKVALGIGALVLVGLIAGAIYYFNLTAPVEVSNATPVAPTLSVNTVPATTAATQATTSAATTAAAQTTASTAPTTTTAATATTPATTTAATTAAQSAATPATAQTSSAQVYRIDAAQSQASYEVREVFINENNRLFTAVGKTSAVAGDILFDRTNPSASRIGEIVVDISQLRSDDTRRDNAIRRQWLESARYPKATFKNATISGLPATINSNEDFSFKITGDMTVRTATRSVTWEAKARLEGNTLKIEATTNLKMSEFGVQPPDIAGFIKSEDNLVLKLSLVAPSVNPANQ